MKFTWGTGILIFLILFLAACGVFIYFAATQKVDLVRDDYYQQGANYSQQMEKESRSAKFVNQIYLKEDEQHVIVFFPDDFSQNLDSGSIYFYRPSDNTKDLLVPMNIENQQQKILRSQLISGRYLVRFSWYSGEEYYVEKEIRLH